MANTKSAKKAARQAMRRTEVNKSRITRARTAVRSVEEAIAAGNRDAAIEALKSAAPILVRTAQKGVHAQEDRKPQGVASHRPREGDGQLKSISLSCH